MAETKIEWCDRVWNPVTGCSPVSAGCDHCYAARMANRLRGRCGYPKDDPFRVTLHPEKLELPLHWKKPQKIFVNSMSDLFHDDVPFEWVDKVFATISLAWRQTFIILTKRPERMKQYITSDRLNHKRIGYSQFGKLLNWPLKNLWLGVSIEDQQTANERTPLLLLTPAAKRLVSVEPMLGTVNVKKYLRYYCDCGICNFCNGGNSPDMIDWVICGGETGPSARPMHPDWVRSLRDQCAAANVPFFFKSWGEWLPISQMAGDAESLYYPRPEYDPNASRKCKCQTGSLQFSGNLLPVGSLGAWGSGSMQTFKVGKKAAGALLDGQECRQFPEVAIG